jgi:hypothetical protein
MSEAISLQQYVKNCARLFQCTIEILARGCIHGILNAESPTDSLNVPNLHIESLGNERAITCRANDQVLLELVCKSCGLCTIKDRAREHGNSRIRYIMNKNDQ